MKRGAALVASTLVLGACGSSSATAPDLHARGPAVYAQVRGPVSAIGVWRDPKRRITFEPWRDGRRQIAFEPAIVWRYDPSTRTLTHFAGDAAVFSLRYLSDRTAWAGVHKIFGITKAKVSGALASGTPSREPVDYRVRAPLRNGPNYTVATDYGRNLARMSKGTGLAIPRLASLGGYRLVDASSTRFGVEIDFGSNPAAAAELRLNIEFEGHGAPPELERPFENVRRWHRVADTRYAIDGAGDAGFRLYGGEWASLDVSATNVLAVDRRSALAATVRAIATAPTAR